MPRYRFGPYEFDSHRSRLEKHGIRVKLQRKPYLVLTALLERPGVTLTRQEFYERLWPDRCLGDFDQGLSVAVNKLRDALDDSSDRPNFIETVAGSGYRFIEAVEVVSELGNGAPVDALGSMGPAIHPNESNGMYSSKGTEIKAVADSTPPQNIGRYTTNAETSRRTHLFSIFTLGVICLVGMIAMAGWLSVRPLSTPHISSYQQITRDGNRKLIAGTDGVNLYLQVNNPVHPIERIPIDGGNPTPITMLLPNGKAAPADLQEVGLVSPDASRMIVFLHTGAHDGPEIWVAGTSGQTAHYLAHGFKAAWSPDGRELVYSTQHGEIYTIPSTGGQSHLVLPAPTPEADTFVGSFAWSPDGKKIRFMKTKNFRDMGIWEVSSDGSNLHRLLPEWDKYNKMCCGQWTPDGSFYLFLLRDRYEAGSLQTEVWALDERAKWPWQEHPQPTKLTVPPLSWENMPVPSPDSRKVFSIGILARGELERFDKQRDRLSPFLGGISAEFVDFSRDGKQLAYVSYPDGILWRSNSDGTGLTKLTSPPIHPKLIQWSPDGKQIVFVDRVRDGGAGVNRFSAVFTISSQGGTPVRLIPEDNEPEEFPSWSPDGKEIVYSTDYCDEHQLNLKSLKTHIFDLASRRIKTLPDGPQPGFRPKMSPDGHYISLLGATPPFNPMIFDVHTQHYSTIRGIPTPNQIALWNLWSHDSRSLYLLLRDESSPSSSIYRVPLKGGKATRVVDLTGFKHAGWYNTWMGLDPTDAPLLLSNQGSAQVYALSLDRK